MKNFVVLSSSRGTTFQGVIDRMRDGSLTPECIGLITDRSGCGCIEKAQTANLPVRIVERTHYETRELFEREVDRAIEELGGNTRETILAAIGWMRMLSPAFVQRWRNRIINVHPSLLPKFPGMQPHTEVLAAGETESGMTIHIVDEGEDTGKKLVQKKCSILPDDTPETLKARVQQLEIEWYPKVLQGIYDGSIDLDSLS